MKNTVTSMQILKEFCEKIFVEHDAKGGCELLTEDVIWYYGSGDNMRSRAEALKFTENEICTMPAPYSIKYVGGESRKISDDTDEVFVRMKVSCLGNYRNINFFATVVNNSGGIFISSIHTAVEVVAEKGDNHTLPKMKFQNIINSIPGGIAIYKVSSVFETVFFSDGVPALTGYSVEEYRELIKCDAAEMTYYEDTEMVKEKIRYALENNTIADFTFRKSHRNGNIVWVRVQGVKIGEQEGFPLLQCIFYNITAEVQSNYKIAEIYNNIPGAIYRCKYNDDWEVIDANDGFFDFLGYSREEFANMGNKLSKVIFPHDMAGVMEKVSAQLVGGNVKIESENRLVCKNGTVKWISLKGQLFFDESGGKCFYCVFIDITYQKKISQQLEIRRSSIEAAINHSNLHYWEYDLGENSAYLSQKSMDDYNFPKVQENFPQSWFDAGKMYAEDIKIYSDAIEKIKNGEKEVQFEVRVLNPESNEYSWKHIIYTNVFNEEGIPIKAIATGEDIDAYKDLESRFTYVMGQNGIYTWEYNIKNATIHLFNNAEFGKFENHSIEFMPKSIIDDGKVHPDGIEDILEMYEKIDRGEKSASCKVQLKLGNKNKWVWYKIDYATIFDRDQKPIRAIGCASNITQQVEAKHKYQELVALQELTEQKSVGSFTINISKNEVMNCRSQAPEFLAFSNMTVDGFFSASRGLVIGEKSREVYDSIFLRDKLFQMFSQGIREKSVEVFYSLGGGRERWLKMFITLTKNPTTGDLIGFTYAVDITRERLWTDMTNAVGSSYFDFMICINVHTQEFLTYIPTEKAVTLNSDYDKRIGAEIQNEVKQFVGLKHEDIFQKFKLSNIIEALEQKSEYRFVFTCTDVNGKMYCKGHTCTYVSEEKNFITLVRNDFYDIYVAEQKKNRELKETLKLAEHANSAKTDFLSAMSHDMRTPMNAIIGMSYLGIESMNLEESREYHKKVNISGKYLLGLINDTLDMSKIDSDKMVLNPEPYFFSEFISSIFTLFKNRAEEKNITFAISENRSAGFAILIDKMRLQQIFVNLINNAIKFTHSGGRVEFFMEALERTDHEITIKFTVSDNGIGMSQDFQTKMFEPFEQEEKTMEESESGTGLGLSIVKRLVELMGGSIACRSQENEGTEFVVILKAEIAVNALKNDGLGHEERGTECLAKKRVLLCEDHPLNMQIAVKLLSKKDMTVECAKNGAIAVEAFANSPIGYYDIILMDIRMPIMDGIEATKKIRSLSRSDSRRVPIIAMTANAFDEDVKKSLLAGLNYHLAKPIEPQKLYEAMAFQIEKAQGEGK